MVVLGQMGGFPTKKAVIWPRTTQNGRNKGGGALTATSGGFEAFQRGACKALQLPPGALEGHG
jgi:hypothetical protein